MRLPTAHAIREGINDSVRLHCNAVLASQARDNAVQGQKPNPSPGCERVLLPKSVSAVAEVLIYTRASCFAVGRRDIEERSKQHPVTHRYLLLSYMHTQSIHTGYTPDKLERPSRRGVLAPAMLCACHRAGRAPADVPDARRVCCDVLAPSPAMQAMQSCAVGFQQRQPTCMCSSTSSIDVLERTDGVLATTQSIPTHLHPYAPACTHWVTLR